jgi:hypothetical protein
MNNCGCDKIMVEFFGIADKFAKLNGYTFTPSKCVMHNCDSIKKFKNTVSKMNIKTLAELIKQTKYRMVYHGTNCFQNAQSILCDGWNVKMRGHKNGQSYGSGEYFTNRYATAARYAGNGNVILSLLLHESVAGAVKTPYCNSEETYYVVENTESDVYVCPIGILNYSHSVQLQCPKNKIMPASFTNIQYYDNRWQDYDPDSIKKIKVNYNKKMYTTVIKPPNTNDSYTIDLIRLTQTNDRTGYIRNVMIV